MTEIVRFIFIATKATYNYIIETIKQPGQQLRAYGYNKVESRQKR